MPGLLAAIPLLFGANAPANGGSAPGLLNALLPLMPVLVLFYILIIRPKQVEDRKRQAMINALKPKDEILTAGGIYGTVVSVDKEKDKVVVRVDHDRGVKLAFSRAYIVKVLESSKEKSAEAE